MQKRKKKQSGISDNALGWITVGLVIAAAIFLDNEREPRKWHAAIWWTAVAFLILLVFCLSKWNSLQFWIFWFACLFFHLGAMWLIFGQLLPRLILDPLVFFEIPIILRIAVQIMAIVEPLLLAVVFFRLQRKPGKT